MFITTKRLKDNWLYSTLMRANVCILSLSLIFSPTAASAQALLNLPAPGSMVAPSPSFIPVLLKGMTVHPTDPLRFDFIVDSGEFGLPADVVRAESERLVKYFLASMTIPEDDLWVNLSPHEANRIIPDALGKTELGRDMLAQDYLLKQLTASLMYPEKDLGKTFWDKVYQRANDEFGTSEIPVDTFNKVWIIPEIAEVYEHNRTVYITDTYLKVMLDSDYQARETNTSSAEASISQQIIKDIIIPEIELEVNTGRHFSALRQIYHSLILAKWYKETIKNTLLEQVYVDRSKIEGIRSDDPDIKDKVYAQYMQAYQKGVFNYIKEDYDRFSNEMIPRKYFSGGLGLNGDVEILKSTQPVIGNGFGADGYNIRVTRSAPERNAVSSPIAIDVDAYSDSTKLQDATKGILSDLVREYGSEGIFNVLDMVNEHPQAGELQSILGTDGYGQVRRAKSSAEGRRQYINSIKSGEWAWLLPAGGDATRLGLGVPKILLNLKQLLSEQENENLRAAEMKALAKGEINQAQINEIESLKSLRDKISSRTIIGRILKGKIDALREVEEDIKRQTFILVPSQGDEQVLADELASNNFYGFGHEAFVIQPQAKNSMYRVENGKVIPIDMKKAGGNGVPIIDTTLEGRGYRLDAAGNLIRLEGTSLSYAESRGVQFINQGTIGDLRSWGEQALNPRFVGRIFDELKTGKISAAAEYAQQNPEFIQKGGTVLFNENTRRLVFVEKLAMGNLENRINFSSQPLATFNHVFSLDALASMSEKSLPLYVRQEKDENGEPILFTELVGGDILTSLQNDGYNIVHVERSISIRELKGTASLIPTILAAIEQDKASSPIIEDTYDPYVGMTKEQIQGVIVGGFNDPELLELRRQVIEQRNAYREEFDKLEDRHPVDVNAWPATVSIRLDRLTQQNELLLKHINFYSGTLEDEILPERIPTLKIQGKATQADTNGSKGAQVTQPIADYFSASPIENVVYYPADPNEGGRTTSLLGENFPNVTTRDQQNADLIVINSVNINKSPENIQEIRRLRPGAKIIIVNTRRSNYSLNDAQASGADLYVRIFETNSINRIAEIIENALKGERGHGYDVHKLNPAEAYSSIQDVGGIDMNNIPVRSEGGKIEIQFDPIEVQRIIDQGFDGFSPVIINMTPLPSVLPLLGLEPKREDEFELSQLN